MAFLSRVPSKTNGNPYWSRAKGDRDGGAKGECPAGGPLMEPPMGLGTGLKRQSDWERYQGGAKKNRYKKDHLLGQWAQ